jgi:hypothetical protein
MKNIATLDDLRKYLFANPTRVCWYGPRSSDIYGLNGLIDISGVIACYGFPAKKIQHLVSNTRKERRRCSIDTLARTLINKGNLQDFVRENAIESILPYDSNPELEEFCKEKSIKLLSSPDKLKDELRDKTRIDEISRLIGLPTIPGVSGQIDEFEFEPLAQRFSLPLFLHFAEGAGGSGNRIVHDRDTFERIKFEKRGRRLNVKKYFTGRSCSIDICVTSNSVLCGPLEEMVIGAAPLNSNPTEYVASSWFQNEYPLDLRKRVSEIGVVLGKLLRSYGFIGFFHPDFLVGSNGQVFLTELNMRFGGSCGVYTEMQVHHGQVPLMLAHALTFLYPTLRFDADKINAQNLEPLDYGLMILKNNFGHPIRISKKYESGIYKVSAEGLSLEKGRFPLSRLPEDSILLRCLPDSQEDTVIHDGGLICEVVTRFPISDSNSNLNQVGKKIAEKLFSKLIC